MNMARQEAASGDPDCSAGAPTRDLVERLRDSSGGHINGLYDREAADEIERLTELADSEGTRAVNYLRRARKVEAEVARLRDLGGARPDEGITAMTERIVAENAQLRAELAKFTPLRAKGVVDADENLDCWDTNPYEICTRHVAALNEKDPAAMWRVVDLFARDEG